MGAAQALTSAAGATFLVVPRALAERLELRPTRMGPIQTAGGREEAWALAEVRLRLDGDEVTTPCLIAAEGPALLGAVPLESLLLAADPVARRLVPVKGFVGAPGLAPPSSRKLLHDQHSHNYRSASSASGTRIRRR